MLIGGLCVRAPGVELSVSGPHMRPFKWRSFHRATSASLIPFPANSDSASATSRCSSEDREFSFRTKTAKMRTVHFLRANMTMTHVHKIEIDLIWSAVIVSGYFRSPAGLERGLRADSASGDPVRQRAGRVGSRFSDGHHHGLCRECLHHGHDGLGGFPQCEASGARPASPDYQYQDLFVAKIDPSGANILYSVLLGPGTPSAIVAGADSSVYVAGAGANADLPRRPEPPRQRETVSFSSWIPAAQRWCTRPN